MEKHWNMTWLVGDFLKSLFYTVLSFKWVCFLSWCWTSWTVNIQTAVVCAHSLCLHGHVVQCVGLSKHRGLLEFQEDLEWVSRHTTLLCFKKVEVSEQALTCVCVCVWKDLLVKDKKWQGSRIYWSLKRTSFYLQHLEVKLGGCKIRGGKKTHRLLQGNYRNYLNFNHCMFTQTTRGIIWKNLTLMCFSLTKQPQPSPGGGGRTWQV